MSLDKMSLEELAHVAKLVRVLLAGATAIKANGVEPVISLAPGQKAHIMVFERMPAVSPDWHPTETFLSGRTEIALPAFLERQRPPFPPKPEIPAGPSRPSPAAASETAKGPESQRASDNGQRSDPAPATEAQPEAVTGAPGTHSLSGQRQPVDRPGVSAPEAAAMVAPAAAEEPSPGAGGGGETGGLPNAWTEEEDAKVVALRVAGKLHREIADELGRSVQAVKFRCTKKLASRIREAAEAIEEKPKSDQEAGEHPTLAEHLAKVPRKDGWDVRRDFDLLHFAKLGWQAAEISIELGVSGKAINERFEILTDKRRFSREAVYAAVAELAGEAAA